MQFVLYIITSVIIAYGAFVTFAIVGLFKLRFQKIDHILISHMHGDHFLGLPGLLQSMHLLGRDRVLNIYGPPEIKTVIDLIL